MQLKKTRSCDVLVIGAGIAGISAALKAAESGSSVILACKGQLFSGSSFYPGTWGLGLIGPADPQDQEDLAESIRQVGCNMTDSEMVRTFVAGIHPAIDRVRRMGVKLRRADNRTQKEFIPCFDHKHRDWNGIEFDSAREVFGQQLAHRNVEILPKCEVLQLMKDEDRICGAVLVQESRLEYVACKAAVLATGGYGSLFKYHLCTEDVMGIGHHLAMTAGCTLVNMEFMQMMPGYITPAYKTVFNEKVFRFTRFSRVDGSPLLTPEEADLLELRSSHGPFTTRLPSKAVDIALFREFISNESGTVASYCEEMKENPPEFVKVYFDWLLCAKGVSMDDPIHVGIFAHAANGGIRIHPDASTGVPGLFAAGEVTGGMHGADRIGGLSTANGLVFGTIAGESAAVYARCARTGPDAVEYETFAAGDLTEQLKILQQTMFENAMVLRQEAGLQEALNTVQQLRSSVTAAMEPTEDHLKAARTQRFLARCSTAESILRAALLRKESRGSHFRTDYPLQDSRQEKRILIRMDGQGIHADYEGEV